MPDRSPDETPRFRTISGGVFDAGADLLVCPVCVVPGVMGAGLARAFARRYPSLPPMHSALVGQRRLRVGYPVTVYPGGGEYVPGAGQYVILFPTKDHFRFPSQARWVFTGLARLLEAFDAGEGGIHGELVPIAVPLLGCGLGGLDAAMIARLIETWAFCLPERYRVTLCLNTGADL